MSVTEKQLSVWKEFVKKIGKLWSGSAFSGYGEDGPYHCGDCEYLVGRKRNDIYRDSNGKGRCLHTIVQLDPKLKKDQKGLAIVNIERGCCEFVDVPEATEETPNPAKTLTVRK